MKIYVALISIGINILNLALPLALLQVYDRIVPNQSWGSAEIVFGTTILALILAGFLTYVRSSVLAQLGALVDHRQDYQLSKSILDAHADPETRRSMAEALGRARDLTVGQGTVAYYDAPFALVFLGLVWFLGGTVVYVPLAIMGVVFLYLEIVRPTYRRRVESLAQLSAEADVALQGAVAQGRENRALQAVSPNMTKFMDLKRRQAALQERVDVANCQLLDIQQSIGLIGTVGIVGIGASLALAGEMTSGGLAACTLLGSRAIAQSTSVLMARFRRDAVVHAAKRVSQLSGATRTSMESLFSDLEAGVHVVDPNTIGGWKEIDQMTSQEGMILVPRRPKLLNGSILENLSGFSRKREPAAEALAQELGLSRLIDHLADGIRTPVGPEKGVPLSQGGVRIASLVRALTDPAKQLVLVDPTRDLDPPAIAALHKVLHAEALDDRVIVIVGYQEELTEAPEAANPGGRQMNVA